MIQQSNCFYTFIVKNDSPEEMNIETMMTGNSENLHLKLWLHFLNKRGFLDTLITEDALKKKNDMNGT